MQRCQDMQPLLGTSLSIRARSFWPVHYLLLPAPSAPACEPTCSPADQMQPQRVGPSCVLVIRSCLSPAKVLPCTPVQLAPWARPDRPDPGTLNPDPQTCHLSPDKGSAVHEWRSHRRCSWLQSCPCHQKPERRSRHSYSQGGHKGLMHHLSQPPLNRVHLQLA